MAIRFNIDWLSSKPNRGPIMSIASKLPLAIMISLMVMAPLSGCLSFSNDDNKDTDMSSSWIDPVIEIENENHSHNDLLAHRLSTPNVKLIDYHNLNCDGNVSPPPELDNVAGRPCDDDFKNTGPTPGDNSEIAIEGNFEEDCVKYPDNSGGCYAYVSSYNQLEILDISNPNDIVLMSTYYAEIARMIDIKVTKDKLNTEEFRIFIDNFLKFDHQKSCVFD